MVRTLLKAVPNPFYGKITTGALSTPTVQLRQLLRPYPQYQDVLIFRDPYGDMHYESMTARVVQQYKNGLQFQLAYTLSKTIANTAQSNTWVVGPSNAMFDANYNRGLEANDVPQRLVLSYLYDLPFGHGKKYLNHGFAATAFGGWEFTGISVFQSGRPILIIGPDQTNLYNFSSTSGRANRLHSPVLSSGQTNSQWFDTTAFAAAAPFTIPTDSLSQPNLRSQRRINTDFSLLQEHSIQGEVQCPVPGRVLQHLQSPGTAASGDRRHQRTVRSGYLEHRRQRAQRTVRFTLHLLIAR